MYVTFITMLLVFTVSEHCKILRLNCKRLNLGITLESNFNGFNFSLSKLLMILDSLHANCLLWQQLSPLAYIQRVKVFLRFFDGF